MHALLKEQAEDIWERNAPKGEALVGGGGARIYRRNFLILYISLLAGEPQPPVNAVASSATT